MHIIFVTSTPTNPQPECLFSSNILQPFCTIQKINACYKLDVHNN